MVFGMSSAPKHDHSFVATISIDRILAALTFPGSLTASGKPGRQPGHVRLDAASQKTFSGRCIESGCQQRSSDTDRPACRECCRSGGGGNELVMRARGHEVSGWHYSRNDLVPARRGRQRHHARRERRSRRKCPCPGRETKQVASGSASTTGAGKVTAGKAA